MFTDSLLSVCPAERGVSDIGEYTDSVFSSFLFLPHPVMHVCVCGMSGVIAKCGLTLPHAEGEVVCH